MAETVKVNFALEPETVRNIERLSQMTHRGKSDVIDWLVAEAWQRVLQANRNGIFVTDVENREEGDVQPVSE